MTIGSAVQRGSLIYVYDEKGRRLTTLLAGAGRKDGLQGYTSATVSVRRGSLLYTYDERGRRLSSTLAGQ
jgi:YD repeat-containing protein